MGAAGWFCSPFNAERFPQSAVRCGAAGGSGSRCRVLPLWCSHPTVWPCHSCPCVRTFRRPRSCLLCLLCARCPYFQLLLILPLIPQHRSASGVSSPPQPLAEVKHALLRLSAEAQRMAQPVTIPQEFLRQHCLDFKTVRDVLIHVTVCDSSGLDTSGSADGGSCSHTELLSAPHPAPRVSTWHGREDSLEDDCPCCPKPLPLCA